MICTEHDFLGLENKLVSLVNNFKHILAIFCAALVVYQLTFALILIFL